ncbi:MAG: N-acetylmuramoyl-L-alanine amidase [Bacteroidales bacterium]|nr:N-acetylmuramoyl-L-alanine amidase [Bacteroidales bacterium]
MLILIDNGHGRETPGKRSPDGLLEEWRWTRQAATLLQEKLDSMLIPCIRLVAEEGDVPLKERVRRANAYGRDALLVSLHCNAAGMGASWMSAHGWSAYVAQNASTCSKDFASRLAYEARAMGLHVRQPLPQQPYWVQSLAICRDTVMPAVLTENMFMDNRDDCAWLLTPEGLATIATLHATAIRQMTSDKLQMANDK